MHAMLTIHSPPGARQAPVPTPSPVLFFYLSQPHPLSRLFFPPLKNRRFFWGGIKRERGGVPGLGQASPVLGLISKRVKKRVERGAGYG